MPSYPNLQLVVEPLDTEMADMELPDTALPSGGNAARTGGPRSSTRVAAPTARVPRIGAPDERRQDAAMVAAARDGDVAAFARLYRDHVDFAFAMAVRLQGNRVDIEDVVHDAFIRAHQQLKELRDAEAFRPWLGSIVVRLVRTRLRRRRLMRGLGMASVEPVEVESVASSDAGPEVRAELAQLYSLLRLTAPDDRIAWALRHVERHRLEATAALCGCSLATVKRRIARAQRFLDQHYVAAGPMVRDGGPDAN